MTVGLTPSVAMLSKTLKAPRASPPRLCAFTTLLKEMVSGLILEAFIFPSHFVAFSARPTCA
eukprot:CAMPEP_0206578750 /NCGR_PEP_ID=MMETSP0325_2-20121206/32147_1 /ASSEMBLY_ACC=CAM_ASM_000347 /TAXON_ID=2866 /ORGANISM="Crypthecodinium cohnii, Strain Seligo" /LENGTH=61 /DNA_ID=CAMNT_0054084445 /DNA_START=442 /DNA_END=627 /DNA_ORIENTATION=+